MLAMSFSAHDPERTSAGSKCRTAAEPLPLTNLLCSDAGLGAADAIRSTETARVHHAARRRGGRVANDGASAAGSHTPDRRPRFNRSKSKQSREFAPVLGADA